jgi:Family of unknown function (DUF6228)
MMSPVIEEFIIQSTASDDSLRIWPVKRRVWRAVLDVTDLHAEARVYERHSGEYLRLGDFFAHLGQSWKGWEGERAWEALGMCMSAVHDGLGNVTLRVTLLRGYGEQWSAEASLRVGAGTLDDLSREARRLDPTPDWRRLTRGGAARSAWQT